MLSLLDPGIFKNWDGAFQGVKMKLPCLPIKGECAEKLEGCGDRWINLIISLSKPQKNL